MGTGVAPPCGWLLLRARRVERVVAKKLPLTIRGHWDSFQQDFTRFLLTVKQVGSTVFVCAYSGRLLCSSTQEQKRAGSNEKVSLIKRIA